MIGAGRLDTLAGVELRQDETTGYTDMSYGFDANNLTYTPVDYAEYFPSYTNGFTQQITEGKIFQQHYKPPYQRVCQRSLYPER